VLASGKVVALVYDKFASRFFNQSDIPRQELIGTRRMVPSQSLELETTTADDIAVSNEYARYVQHCRRHQRSDIIANTAYVNAQFIMGQLLLLALDKHYDVRLLSGKLDNKTYNSLMPVFQRVLDAGNKIKILILSTHDSLQENDVYTLISEHANGRYQVLNEQPDSMMHFMLVGDTAYRVEFDDTTKQAYACFNDKDGLVVGHYMNLFKEKWNEAAGRIRNGNRGLVGAS
jgi:hypothetical protein